MSLSIRAAAPKYVRPVRLSTHPSYQQEIARFIQRLTQGLPLPFETTRGGTFRLCTIGDRDILLRTSYKDGTHLVGKFILKDQQIIVEVCTHITWKRNHAPNRKIKKEISNSNPILAGGESFLVRDGGTILTGLLGPIRPRKLPTPPSP